MDKRKLPIFTVTVLCFVLLGAAFVLAQYRYVAGAQQKPEVGQPSLSTTTPILLQYQGRLTDPGTGDPVPDGSYTMVLRLYGEPSGGTPLWAEAKDVPVQDGLFSTVLGETTPLSQDLFKGAALWLAVKVGADEEAMPRQQVLPVAYALSLLPGATVQANGGIAALSVSNTGAGHALHAAGSVDVDGDLTVSGSINNPGIVTRYELDDHIYGGMHSGRAIAYGVIDENGELLSSSGNISSRWNNLGRHYEITIDGHDYDWRSYVTIVTPVLGGITSAWSIDGTLYVGIYKDSTSPGLKTPFQFVTFKA
jgi:hypothetical protein